MTNTTPEATPDYTGIQAAVQFLASVCDYASSEDGQGYNGTDTYLGHQLAALPYELWTGEVALAAWDMIRKYRRQLEGQGIDYDTLPVPPGAAELLADRAEQAKERRQAARENAKNTTRTWRQAETRKAKSYVLCEGEGEQIILGFPYDPALVAEARDLPGRAYDDATKTNRYPFTSLPEVTEFADKYEIPVPQELRPLVPIAKAEAVRLAAELAARPDITVNDKGKVILDKAWDSGTRAMNDALKEHNGGRSTWDRELRVHKLNHRKNPGRLMELIAEFKLTLSDDARQLIEGDQAEQAATKAAATALTADPIDIPGLAADAALMPQQFPVVHFAIKHRRIIVGDEMGWGKTLSSLAAVAADGAYPAVVVCRPALTLNWAAELRRFFPALSVHEASGTTPTPIPEGTDIVIIGTAALGKVLAPPEMSTRGHAKARREPLETVDPTRTTEAIHYLLAHPQYGTVAKIVEGCRKYTGDPKAISRQTVKRRAEGDPTPVQRRIESMLTGMADLAAGRRKAFGWLPVLEAIKPKALIFDEGQDGKSQTANRSQAIEALAAPIRKRGGLVLDLTGTAIINRPVELLQQLKILGREDEFGGAGAFLVRYCEGESNGYGRTFNGAHNLTELNDLLLRRGIMIRRNDDAALGLPTCTQRTITIPTADLDPKVMKEYEDAERDTASYLADQAREIAKRLGKDPESAAVQAAMKANAAEHLVQLNALRKLVGSAKLEAADAIVTGLISQGEKVMVAAHHREVVTAFAKRHGGLKIQGGQSVESKEADKAKFQTLPLEQAPVISVAITAGGVGYTLTAARKGVQAEWPWTPGDKNQMAKRMHRIGQDRPVEYLLLTAEGTVDEYMQKVVSGKERTLRAVLDGEVDEGADESEKSAVAAVAWELTKQGLRA